MLKKLLIANRGEIAVRIIKACQELGIQTVAVFSEADAHAQHTLLADEAIPIGPADPSESYLRVDKLINAARQTGCGAVHPGYGFLSENADFAEAVIAAGLIFVGPHPDAIRTMGNKTAARQRMQQAGVPVVPGFDKQDASQVDLVAAAKQIGYPIMVKASAGGGGKGMRVVEKPDDLADALDAARREAQSAFGDDQVYLEKYLPHPRHIEIQILADQHGNIMHLFERECSIQRRHQKIIEETPAPWLDIALCTKMAEAAVAAAQAVDYVNAGTVEFLVDDSDNFYFLEMNTRLQVEHPITEAVTGISLVQAQLRIASGEPLSITQTEITQRGHAIECRIYAEDPANQFLPATGPILQLVEPTGPGIRIDSGIRQGDEVTVHYDPLLAKLIVYAADREAAIRKLDWALRQYAILGVTTNIAFLRDVIGSDAFATGQTDTHFIDTHFADLLPDDQVPDIAFIAAVLYEQIRPDASGAIAEKTGSRPYDPWETRDGFRLGRTI